MSRSVGWNDVVFLCVSFEMSHVPLEGFLLFRTSTAPNGQARLAWTDWSAMDYGFRSDTRYCMYVVAQYPLRRSLASFSRQMALIWG